MKTWNEALEAFDLNYELVKEPLHDAQGNAVPGVYGIRRVDSETMIPKVSVGDRYEVIQNTQFTAFADAVAEGLNVDFTAGGHLKGGRIAYLQADLPNPIRILGTDDIVESKITFMNSYDGSTNFMVFPFSNRIFCANQLNMLRKLGWKGLNVRHTRNADQYIQDAAVACKQIDKAVQDFSELANALAGKQLKGGQFEEVLLRTFDAADKPLDEISTRAKNSMDTIRGLYVGGKGINENGVDWRGTGWAALNAFTEYADHHRQGRGGDYEGRQVEVGLLGSGAAFKQKAVDALVDVVL